MQNESTRVQNSKWRQILAIAIPCLIGWGYTYFSIFHFHDYSYSLFIGIPLAMGAVSTFIMGVGGTTWYENRIRPAFYWTLWSDYIVHKIHNRVLTHIRNETEKKGSREKTL